MLTEIEIFEILKRKRLFFENVGRNEFLNFNWKFTNMLTEIEIFEFFNRNRIFFENVDRNRDYPNFLIQIEFFSQMLTENKIFEILNRNRFFF